MSIFNRYSQTVQVPADAGTPSTPGIPPGMAQIVNSVEMFMPAIEKITGLTRRDIFLAVLKGGMRGQSFESILNTLMGHQEKEVKFVRYVKTLAIWVPVAVLLFGLAMVSIIVFAKFLIVILGVF
jgi:hypothetical protein